MKKIINNLVYNTKTAREVATSERNPGQFSYVSETLYRKKTGEYFLYGEGGPESKYSKPSGQNSWVGGEKIIPLTYEEALKWSEDNLDADDYIEEFGDPGEGEEMEYDEVRFTLTLPGEVHRKLQQQQSQTGETMAAIVAQILDENL